MISPVSNLPTTMLDSQAPLSQPSAATTISIVTCMFFNIIN